MKSELRKAEGQRDLRRTDPCTMPNSSGPFFPGFHRVLFGRPPRALARTWAGQRERWQAATLGQLRKVFGRALPPQLSGYRTARGAGSRRRIFDIPTTFWAALQQAFCPGSSQREAVARVQAHWRARTGQDCSGQATAFCQARQRLPMTLLEEVLGQSAEHSRTLLGEAANWRGHRVWLVDGTGLLLPDTPANQERWPQSKSQQPGCGFPLTRLLGVFDLGTGALHGLVQSDRHTHDQRLFGHVLEAFAEEDVVVGDRAFCAWSNFAQLHARGAAAVFRQHQRRPTDFRRGRRLGPEDHLVVWPKPQRPPEADPAAWAALPAQLTLREVRVQITTPGLRTRSLVLVTTLLDAVRYPREEIAALYQRRWQIELCFDDLKTTLGLETLRAKSPASVQRELFLRLIAYNLLRSLMARTACTHHLPVMRLSFRGSLDRARQYLNALGVPQTRLARRRLRALLLEAIARDALPHRPGRREPRAVKRRAKSYQLLNRPRHLMRELRHRNHYRACA